MSQVGDFQAYYVSSWCGNDLSDYKRSAFWRMTLTIWRFDFWIDLLVLLAFCGDTIICPSHSVVSMYRVFKGSLIRDAIFLIEVGKLNQTACFSLPELGKLQPFLLLLHCENFLKKKISFWEFEYWNKNALFWQNDLVKYSELALFLAQQYMNT